MLKTMPELVAEARANLNTLTADEASAMQKAQGGVIIDVRDEGEYQSKAAKGTVHVSRGMLESKMPTLYPDASTPIFIHCASGGRATFAAEQLQRMGYENVWVITCKVDDVITALN